MRALHNRGLRPRLLKGLPSRQSDGQAQSGRLHVRNRGRSLRTDGRSDTHTSDSDATRGQMVNSRSLEGCMCVTGDAGRTVGRSVGQTDQGRKQQRCERQRRAIRDPVRNKALLSVKNLIQTMDVFNCFFFIFAPLHIIIYV